MKVLEWQAEPTSLRRRLLHRQLHVSGEVLAYVRGCSQKDMAAFADLVLRLDANPIQNSEAILTSIGPPGLRWARFSDHLVTFQWDPVADAIRLAFCEPADE
jgi:hypothetical protein